MVVGVAIYNMMSASIPLCNNVIVIFFGFAVTKITLFYYHFGVLYMIVSARRGYGLWSIYIFVNLFMGVCERATN